VDVVRRAVETELTSSVETTRVVDVVNVLVSDDTEIAVDVLVEVLVDGVTMTVVVTELLWIVETERVLDAVAATVTVLARVCETGVHSTRERTEAEWYLDLPTP